MPEDAAGKELAEVFWPGHSIPILRVAREAGNQCRIGFQPVSCGLEIMGVRFAV